MSEQTAANAPKTPKKRRWRRIIAILGILALLLVLLIAVAPWVVAHTGLRDPVINDVLASPSVTASSESASFEWFSPLSIHELHLRSPNDHVDINVEDITADRSLSQLLASEPDLGTVRVEKPHVTVELPLDVKVEGSHRLEPTFTAITKHDALTVRLAGQDDPSIDVDDIDMTFRVEKAEEGRVLTLDPVVIFDRQKLSPKLASKLLHLFDPTLGDAPQVSGEISLSLDKLRIPLGVSREEAVRRMEVEGKLVLHQVSVEARRPMGQALVRLVADMNGKQAPEVVHLAQDAEIHFQVRDGRLYHEGLRVGFPDIDPELVVSSHGSVGLDKTLDLYVDLPRLDKALRKEKGPAKCRITGTIDNPKVAVEDASLVLRRNDRTPPVIAADGVSLTMQVEDTPSGRVLAVEPVEVFKRKKLSLGAASGLVQMLVPDFRSEGQLTGEVSLSFKSLRIPLGVTGEQLLDHVEAEGKLTLHEVTADVKGPMWQALIKVIADLNGKQPSNTLHVAEDSEISFRVRDGRLYHDGLRVGFPGIDPDLVVSSHGSISFDETLDLYVDLPRLRKEKRDQGPVPCHITGTISRPQIDFPAALLLVQLKDGDKPTLKVDDVPLCFSVEASEDERVLTLAPVTIFKKQKLTPEVGDDLLHLIAPTLSDITGVQGEISLSLQRFRVPLGVPRSELVKKVDLSGTLQLHQLSISTKTPLVQTMVKMLADMYGKKPSDVVRVVEDAKIRFEVREGRMYHEGLRIGFPDISPDLVANSRGSVGFDDSLDLELEVPRIVVKDKTNPADTKVEGLVRFRVTGTIDKPVVTEIK
jgi:hypothetical protein